MARVRSTNAWWRLVLASSLLLLSAAPAPAADIALGRTLHDERCLFCHGVENYMQPKSKIKSLKDLRAMVQRWDGVMRPAFTDEERVHVVAYLNATFYKFVEPSQALLR